MNADHTDRPSEKKDVVKRSFEKETSEQARQSAREREDSEHRSILGAPVDPNAPTTEGDFPPGVSADDMRDPGRMTPGAPAVENRSGTNSEEQQRKD